MTPINAAPILDADQYRQQTKKSDERIVNDQVSIWSPYQSHDVVHVLSPVWLYVTHESFWLDSHVLQRRGLHSRVLRVLRRKAYIWCSTCGAHKGSEHRLQEVLRDE